MTEWLQHPASIPGRFAEPIAVLMKARAELVAEAAEYSRDNGPHENRWRSYEYRTEMLSKAIDWLTGEWGEKPRWRSTPTDEMGAAMLSVDLKERPVLVWADGWPHPRRAQFVNGSWFDADSGLDGPPRELKPTHFHPEVSPP